VNRDLSNKYRGRFSPGKMLLVLVVICPIIYTFIRQMTAIKECYCSKNIAIDMGCYKITCVCLSVSQSVSQCVCRCSYGRNFFPIFIKCCTMVGGLKSNIKFVWGEDSMTPSVILPHFFTPVMHFQWKDSDRPTTVRRPDDL